MVISERMVVAEEVNEYTVLTLNRPEKRNAISREMSLQLRAALKDTEDKKVLVLTGKGTAFCAGIDLGERASSPSWAETLGAHDGQFWFETLEALRRHPAVIVAAVNGYALGGGLTLVNLADIAVAAEGAEFGMPEMSFGSFPALSGPSTLQRILPKHAAEMIFCAQRASAEKAREWGVINEVVASGSLMQRARQLAETIVQHDARALAFGKRAVANMERMSWTEASEYGILISAMVRRFTAEEGSPC